MFSSSLLTIPPGLIYDSMPRVYIIINKHIHWHWTPNFPAILNAFDAKIWNAIRMKMLKTAVSAIQYGFRSTLRSLYCPCIFRQDFDPTTKRGSKYESIRLNPFDYRSLSILTNIDDWGLSFYQDQFIIYSKDLHSKNWIVFQDKYNRIIPITQSR
jgi:hypothetical protein